MPGISEHENHVRLSLASIDTTIKHMAAAAQQQLANRSVLACETWQFDGNGLIARSWHVPYAAVSVSSTSTNPITVSSSPPQPSAPASGPGVAVVVGSAVVNIAGHALTLYGTPGDTVTIEVFAATQPPAWAATATTAAAATTTTSSVVMRPASPAAGQPAVLTVPAGQTWTVRSAYAHFTTGTETAGRMLTLSYADGTGAFAVFPNPAPISVPSNTYTPTWGENLGQYDTAHTSRAAGLDVIALQPGMQVQISATSLQPDDQFSNVAVCVDVTDATESASYSVMRPANPAAGQPITLTVPTGVTWTVQTAAVSLKLGAETVDRMAVVNYLDTTGVFASFPCPGTVTTAGAVINPTWGDGLGQYESTHQTRAAGLDSIVLTAGMQVQFNVVGMQADDTLTSGVVYVDVATAA